MPPTCANGAGGRHFRGLEPLWALGVAAWMGYGYLDEMAAY